MMTKMFTSGDDCSHCQLLFVLLLLPSLFDGGIVTINRGSFS